MTPPPGITKWASLPGPAVVLDAVRTRARRGYRTESGTLSAVVLDDEQRTQVGRMLGIGWELSGKPVRLQDLAARLAEHGLTVRGLVEALGGTEIEPDRVRRERERDAAAAERDIVVEQLSATGVTPSEVRKWLAEGGLPKPGTGALTALSSQIANVVSRLRPGHGSIRLARLAADVLHDAHALDYDRPLGRGTARFLASIKGLDRPHRAGRAWRAAWASAGVLCDGVSSRVLALNLPIGGESAAARLCRATPGEPIWLTLRSLAGPWTARACEVFVCENPTVTEAAADALGARCPALVCTDGIASGAALDLIAGLVGSGCTIRARADFDRAGFTIAEQVLAVAPRAVPWRFDAPAYARARALSVDHRPAADLESAVAGLREIYDGELVPVHEERLLEHLIADLSTAAQDCRGGSASR
ncbi:DUF2399 domain-containing protein [Saccharopolyspora sp. NFXS83]|uniref:TIGR02679 domain-containing protein n=1 Tax=Saccharopolyspora sp. NFXS83 TaxID=2993560 RepID=UPI00224A4D9A|nr:TIGR02679 domain-containing protein [Saccharopolyspora sp. NFXS83]MCX2730669.1 DUF2399 domain-containing protein [Saccharopolyspora sp. NFXS83]